MKALLQSLPVKSAYTRVIIKMISGQVLVHLIGLAAYPFFSRLYSPDQLGEYALVGSLLSIMVVLATARLEAAYVLAENSFRKKNLLVFSIIILIGFVVLCLGFARGLGYVLSFFDIYYPKVSFWVPAILLSSGLVNIALFWQVSRKRFSQNIALQLLQKTGFVVLALGIGFYGVNQNGLLTSLFVSSLVMIFYVIVQLKDDIRFRFKTSALRYTFQTFSRYKGFSLFSVLDCLLYLFSVYLPFLLISRYFGHEWLGYFSLTFMMISLPQAVAGSVLGDLFYERAATLMKNKEKIRPFLYKIITVVLVLTLPVTFLLFQSGDWLFAFVFGQDWQVSGEMAMLMALLIPVFVLNRISPSIFAVFRVQKIGIAFNLAKVLGSFLSFYAGSVYADFWLGLRIFIGMNILVFILQNILVLHFANKRGRVVRKYA
jgi:lipopolysaccharide exporter